ncbi:MAG: DUF2510 domain-containing protein [Candidatus Limnocylindria bacterium]
MDDDHPLTIEVNLDDSDSATEIEIIGTDSEATPLSEEMLIAELSRVRDAIKDSLEDAEHAPTEGPPAGWYQDPNGAGSRWWDGSKWTEHHIVESTQVSAPRVAQVGQAPVGQGVALGGQPRAFWIATVAVIFLAIGSLGPWATLGVFSKAGIDGDGQLTIILAIIAALALWAFSTTATSARASVVLICGVLAAGVGIIDAMDVSNTTFLGQTGAVQVGWGLGMVCIASIALALAAFALTRSVRGIQADS